MSFVFGQKSMHNMIGLKTETIKLCNLAISISTVDFSIIDGLRTAEEQNKLYKSGKSMLDGINKKSAHQSGLAIDVFPYVKGVDCWDTRSDKVKALWAEVHRAFLRAAFKLNYEIELGIAYDISGGRDYPHIQIERIKG